MLATRLSHVGGRYKRCSWLSWMMLEARELTDWIHRKANEAKPYGFQGSATSVSPIAARS